MRNCAKTDFSNDLAIMGTKLPRHDKNMYGSRARRA